MRKNREWGDNVMVTAIALAYKTPIMVLCCNSHEPFFITDDSGSDLNDKMLFKLGYINDHHYVSLVPVDTNASEVGLP